MERQVTKLEKAEEFIKDGKANKALPLVEAVKEFIRKEVEKKASKKQRQPSKHNEFIKDEMKRLKAEFPEDKPQERLIKANQAWTKQKTGQE